MVPSYDVISGLVVPLTVLLQKVIRRPSVVSPSEVFHSSYMSAFLDCLTFLKNMCVSVCNSLSGLLSFAVNAYRHLESFVSAASFLNDDLKETSIYLNWLCFFTTHNFLRF